MEEIELWARDALPGSIRVYFISAPGRLIGDLEHKAVREAAMRLSDEGRVSLFQRKRATDRYEYIMVRRSAPRERMKVEPPKMAGVRWS